MGSGDATFAWTDVDVDWEDGQTVSVRIVEGANTPATGAPTISGTAAVGQTLTANTDGIADEDGLDDPGFTYQWIANDGTADADIVDATGETYTVSDDDVGKTIKVKVSFEDDAGNKESLTSAATAEVTAVWTATLTVEVRDDESGYSFWSSPVLGALSDTDFEVDGTTSTVRYVLLVDGELNLGLDEPLAYSFVLRVGEQEFSSKEAKSESNGAAHRYWWPDPGLGWTDDDEVEVSLALVNSDQNAPATGAPTIGGTAQAGEKLTASTDGIADDDGLDDVSYSYQWIRVDGGTDTHITGKTDETYTLATADVGKTIKVRVSFADDEGNREVLTSAPTAVVAATNPLTGFTVVDASASPQTVLGTLVDGGTLLLGDPANGSYGIRLDTEAGMEIGSVRLELTGPLTVDRTENIAPYSLHGDNGENALNGGNLPAGSYTLTATAYSEGSLGGTEVGKLTVSFTVAAAAPLTVSLESEPSTHDGSTAFTFEIRFSENIADLSYLTLRNHAFTVTGGEVTKAQRMDGDSDTPNIHWRITVEPDGNGDVTIVLPVTTDCDAQGAICTADKRKLSTRLDFTVSGPGG